MPKLNSDIAQSVLNAESRGGPMPAGRYEAELSEVETGEGPAGPKWVWIFRIPKDAPKYGGKPLWLHVSLADSMRWKMKEVFVGFGVTPDTHTDELIGRRVTLEVSEGTIQAGPKAGDPSNSIEHVLPLDSPGKAGSSLTDDLPF